MDRRRQTRFPLKIDAEVQAVGKVQLPEPHKTVTHDISGTGLFLQFEQPLREGTRLLLKLHLPPNLIGRKVTVCCVARVVRVISKDGHTGVGAEIKSYEFFREKRGRAPRRYCSLTKVRNCGPVNWIATR